jgi:hypothetical protein
MPRPLISPMWRSASGCEASAEIGIACPVPDIPMMDTPRYARGCGTLLCLPLTVI